MSCTILFVDDEPSMLRSLRRMLFELEDSWTMHFASSAQEALDILANEPIEVLVADLKMPGMDGVELLEQVREMYPGVVRIILSGYSDKSRLMKSTKAAHQFLSKPSSPDEIQNTVERMLALHDVELYDAVRQTITKMESLPVLPTTYDELMRIANSESSTIAQVGELVSRDMGLTASVLKLVNSAFFGLPQQVNDPIHAVSLLGLDTIKGLVLVEHFVSKFESERYPEFNMENLWEHSVATAHFAKTIVQCESKDPKLADLAYVGGLLHDLGKLILAEAFEDDYRGVILLANDRNISTLESEREIIKATHAEIGSYLMGLWGFADPVIHAIACHHSPSACTASPLVTAVHAANALEHELVVFNHEYASHPVDMDYLETAGLTDRYQVWRETCEQLHNSI